MAASKAFDKILDCVKSSNLNFCLQLSPFSANISLKKTLVKDKAGFYLTHPENSDLSLLQNHDEEKKELAATLKEDMGRHLGTLKVSNGNSKVGL